MKSDKATNLGLLSDFGEGDAHNPKNIDRLKTKSTVEIIDKMASVKDQKFARQYAPTYNTRLQTLKPILEEKFKEEWQPQKIVLKKIADLCEGNQSAEQKIANSPKKGNKIISGHEQRVAFHENVFVAIIGTVFKHQPEKPSILQELNEDNPILPVVAREKYTSDKDYVLLEDETTRVKLVPTRGCGIEVKDVVNGVVCAVKGKPTTDGKFEVDEVLWPTPARPIWPTFKKPNEIEMIFISGLQLGRALEPGKEAAVDLLFDYLMGLGGSVEEQTESIAHRSRVFFVGNQLFKAKQHYVDSVNDKLVESAKRLDKLVDELGATCEVFLLPGTSDPGQAMLPQPPLHRAIIPKSYRRDSFRPLSNPCEIRIDFPNASTNLDIILTSGENVADGLRNCDLDSPLDMAQSLLQWSHLCPTAPDTLALHPGASDSSFVLVKSLPHIFAIGNQKTYDCREWCSTKLVSIPSFCESATAVIFTKDFEFIPLQFSIG